VIPHSLWSPSAPALVDLGQDDVYYLVGAFPKRVVGRTGMGLKPFERSVLAACLLAAVAVWLLRCGPGVKQQERMDRVHQQLVQPQTGPSLEPAPKSPAPQPAAAKASDEVAAVEFSDIHFDFDRYNLKSDARRILDRIAFVMLEHPELSLVIEGHCDERGSNEYNLALGERRAVAARDYLIEMGVEPHRIRTVSYGEERPIDPRHCEEAWAKNRRAHFVKVVK